MKSSDLTPLFPKPFGYAADNGTILTPLPDTKSSSGRASLEKGFPTETMQPLAAGGSPPRGEDINGIFNMLSTVCQRTEAGYVTPWTLSFANDIGGYPQGAVVSYGGASQLWISLDDNNTATPGSNATQWQTVTADCIKTTASLSSDQKILTMNVNTGADRLGTYVQVNDARGSGYRVPTDGWVKTYAGQTFLPLTGGSVSGTVYGDSTNDAARIVWKANNKPAAGTTVFRWGTCYWPLGSSGYSEAGKVYVGYQEYYGSTEGHYKIQLNPLDGREARTWDFTNHGTIQTPEGNEYLEVEGVTGKPRKMICFNTTGADQWYIGFHGQFKSDAVVLNITPQDGTVVHTVGFRNLSARGFNLSIFKWDGSNMVPETVPLTVCIQAVGAA